MKRRSVSVVVLSIVLVSSGSVAARAIPAPAADRDRPDSHHEVLPPAGSRAEGALHVAAATPLLAAVDREVARAVKAEIPTLRLHESESSNRPFARNALVGAAIGGAAGAIGGYQIDSNEVGRAGGNTAAYALLGAGIGAGIGALTALIR